MLYKEKRDLTLFSQSFKVLNAVIFLGFDILVHLVLCFTNFMTQIYMISLESFNSGQHYFFNFFVPYLIISWDSPMISWGLSISVSYMQIVNKFIFYRTLKRAFCEK